MNDSENREFLARRVIDLAKSRILVTNHYLAAAVGRLPLVADDLADLAPFASCAGEGERADGASPAEGTPWSAPLFATDAIALHFDPDAVLAAFKDADAPAPIHDLLHAVLHCVFLHPFVGRSIDARWWNLASDMAAERAVAECLGPRQGSRGAEQARVLSQVERDLGRRATAEHLYRQLEEGRWGIEPLGWEQLFYSDSHGLWYTADGDSQSCGIGADDQQAPNSQGGQGGQGQDTGSGQGESDDDQQGSGTSQGGESASDQLGGGDQGGSADDGIQQEWRDVANDLAMALETFGRSQGIGLGNLVDEIRLASREPVDYRTFLRRFASNTEVMHLSPDEFDYVYYTYGLDTYGNLPLIEPLEYRDDKRIRQFVIVIDTSGSVQGDIVRRFIQATYDVLHSTETFHQRINLHIIQCDYAVRSDDLITTPEELAQWGETFTVHGGGGTSFAPAFRYVDQLLEEGAFNRLEGLIYFTDGWGSYPDWTPAYKSAFVFYDEDYRPENVPPWAIQVVLDQRQMERM